MIHTGITDIFVHNHEQMCQSRHPEVRFRKISLGRTPSARGWREYTEVKVLFRIWFIPQAPVDSLR